MITRPVSPLLTDLYQFTMLQAYLDQGMDDIAVFEFFVRKLPSGRNFLMAAGLESVLEFLPRIRFEAAELRFLEQTGRFNERFLDYLKDFQFTGDVHAMPEGQIFFADEPILRITAPITQAQLIETRLINLLHYQTLAASKAARVVLAAPDKLLVDFGLRRAHGAEAGMLAARAAYLAGFHGSSNVQAEYQYGIPSYGTMAHSFIQAHDEEALAFEHFAHSQPDNTTLLIDTYDTEAAAHEVVALARQGVTIKAVRIDSGDLGEHAMKVRAILDAAGFANIGIFASGNLDEYEIERLLAARAPINGFGVGTRMLTSSDAPYLDCAYKLQEYAGHARRKRSEGKATWPGRKQVYRAYGEEGVMLRDTLTLENGHAEGVALIAPVMSQGRRIGSPPTLAQSRHFAARELARLPQSLRATTASTPYPVAVAEPVRELSRAVDEHRA